MLRYHQLSACLHGARDGLLELHWDLLCPVCRISCQVTDTLRAIAEHVHCEACHLNFQLDFASSIELIFRVHPEIRNVYVRNVVINNVRYDSYEANRRNYALLTQHLDHPHRNHWRDWLFLAGVALVVCAIFAVPILFVAWLLDVLFTTRM